MAYEVIVLCHLHMPLYFRGTFTEYPFLLPERGGNKIHAYGVDIEKQNATVLRQTYQT